MLEITAIIDEVLWIQIHKDHLTEEELDLRGTFILKHS